MCKLCLFDAQKALLLMSSLDACADREAEEVC